MKVKTIKSVRIPPIISVILSVTVLFSGGVFVRVYATYISNTSEIQNIPHDTNTFIIGTSRESEIAEPATSATAPTQNTPKPITCSTTVSSETYSENDLYWLSKIIHAESRGESFEGKIAVGNVVLNRVKNPSYPNTIYDVIFDIQNGVQFSPIADGSIYLEADEESVRAAKACLEGQCISQNILFFVNNDIAKDSWVKTNRTLEISIGNHDFYT